MWLHSIYTFRYTKQATPLLLSHVPKVVRAPVVAWVNFPLSSLKYDSGKPELYQSSKKTQRGFCPKCGSTLFALDEGSKDICMTTAVLDDRDKIVPKYESFKQSSSKWLHIPDVSTSKTQIHHLALTASDLEVSGKFYDAILNPLGYSRHSTRDGLCTWTGVSPEILLYKASPEKRENKHEIYSPGIHHVAFKVNEKGLVDQVYEIAKVNNIKVLDVPNEYSEYSDGYYAVFLADPDGIKIEMAYIPTPTS